MKKPIVKNTKAIQTAQKSTSRTPIAKQPITKPMAGRYVQREMMRRAAKDARPVVLTKGAAQKSGFSFRQHVDPTGLKGRLKATTGLTPAKAPVKASPKPPVKVSPKPPVKASPKPPTKAPPSKSKSKEMTRG